MSHYHLVYTSLKMEGSESVPFGIHVYCIENRMQ